MSETKDKLNFMLKISLKKYRRRKIICHGSNPKQMSENEISNHQGSFGIIYVLFLCFYFWNSFFDTCFYEIYIKEQCFVCIGETGFLPQILVYIFLLENRKTTFFLFLIFFFVFLFLNCISQNSFFNSPHHKNQTHFNCSYFISKKHRITPKYL